MRLFSQSSEPQQRAVRRPLSLSLTRHIFTRVAFPVGIVFLSSFSLLDNLVQDQLRDHIRQELLTVDAQTHKAGLTGATVLRRSASLLAAAAGIPQALAGQTGSQQENLVAERLRRLDESLDEDIYAIFDANKTPVAMLRRFETELRPVTPEAPLPDSRRLIEFAGQFYFLNSYPLNLEGKQAGWLVTGRQWLRDMPIGEGTYFLARQGKVLEKAGNRAGAKLAAGATLPPCANLSSSCDVEIGGTTHVLLRSAASLKDDPVEILLIRPFDTMASPLLSMTRWIMLGGALLSLLGALGLALLTGRAVSRPLKEITESCHRAQEKGNLAEIDIPSSRIDEVNALGKTLQSAVRSIEAGQSQLTQAYFQFMGAIVALLDARDTYTAGHSHRVSAYSEALARDFGLPQQQIDDIRVGALLHDIGKIGVPDEVLRKHDRLTKEEFDLMKQHPTIGRKVLEQVVQFEKYLDAVELHHESLDGSGYPRGLRGEQIPISARIVKVADVYDALSTDRPYRKKMSVEEVHNILREGAGKHFDRLLVEIFLTRSLPSFERKSSLEQLYLAVGDVPLRSPEKKAMSA